MTGKRLQGEKLSGGRRARAGRRGGRAGINRWEEQQESADKTGRDPDELPKGKKGDESSRVRSSGEPAEDREKQEVVKKLRDREGNGE